MVWQCEHTWVITSKGNIMRSPSVGFVRRGGRPVKSIEVRIKIEHMIIGSGIGFLGALSS